MIALFVSIYFSVKSDESSREWQEEQIRILKDLNDITKDIKKCYVGK